MARTDRHSDPTEIITYPLTLMVIKRIIKSKLGCRKLVRLQVCSKLQKRHRIEIYENNKNLTEEITPYLSRFY